jgi:hypothetical protein
LLQKEKSMRIQQCIAALLASSFVLPALPVHAGEQVVELMSNGRYQTHRVPDGTVQIQLLQPLAGSCQENRSWGHDIGRRELWVRDGCGGRFRILTQDQGAQGGLAGQGEPGVGEEKKDNTGAWIAGAAVAAIAGAAILANKRDRDKERERERDDYYDDNRYPGSNQPGYPSWGGQEIRGQNGLCLDVSGGLRPGNALIVYRCTGSENQRFTYTRQGELRAGNLCLDVAEGNTREGTRIIAWECRNQPNQKWDWSRGEIRSRYANKCMDIEGGNARPGQPVIMWNCAGSSNQRWN